MISRDDVPRVVSDMIIAEHTFTDWETYRLYLKSTTDSGALIIWVQSLGNYCARAPDGGCWLFSNFVEMFHDGDSDFLPRGCRSLPHLATANLLSALLSHRMCVVY